VNQKHQEWINKPYVPEVLSSPEGAAFDMDQIFNGRFEFVHTHYRPGDKMINLACGTDDGGYKERYGAVNVDVGEYASSVDNFYQGTEMTPFRQGVVDYVCDIRELPDELKWRFDCAVLGDVMEHCDTEAGLAILSSAKETLVDTGRIMIIFPEDFSCEGYMERNPDQAEFYSPGIYSYHRQPPLNKEEMVRWLEEARLHIVLHMDLWYPPTTVGNKIYPGVGYGIIVEKDRA
jgi:predicted SAM-dependent methyltransferase